MMDWTDRHCRSLLRFIAPRTLLYTEMVVADAIIHGDRDHLLGYEATQHPVALQLGGSDPTKLAVAARVGAEYGYDEINLNCGCPSDRVREGTFGACLMAHPQRVADCVAAMIAAVPATVPVTVKCRLGIDHRDDWAFLEEFITTVAAAGCGVFIVHARQAILGGLTVVLNGGLKTAAESLPHLAHVDGVMLGREAYHRPYVLAELEQALWGGPAAPTEEEVADWLADYAARHVAAGGRVHDVARHALGLFTGKPGARAWRRYLSEWSNRRDVTPAMFRQAATVARQLSVREDAVPSL